MSNSTGRFDHVKYDDKAIAHQDHLKEHFDILAGEVEATLPKGRAQSLVLTKLEEAYMWVGKALRDEQVANREAVTEEDQSGSNAESSR